MGTNSSAPFPKQQCGPRKLVHLVRHAQGMHNLESDKSRDPLTSCEFFDAQLSSQGWQQVRHQRKDVCASGLLQGIQLVITSPMSSTLQTAVGIFHGEDQQDRLDVTSFPDETDQTQAFNHPPIIAFELCRERLGKYECDKRRSTNQYRSRFPAVDFSLVVDEERGGDSSGTNKCLPLMEHDPRSRRMKFIRLVVDDEFDFCMVVPDGSSGVSFNMGQKQFQS
ncbi:hypothetical protein V6N12_074855 [Hibiscus sabdariffa]|uniref:Phosphoglycerate mutase-like protein n=1 Tax=Hibiscus sabdariffa TaxID=183260 RepID=A0ABR2D2K8_9ROSI